MIKTTLLSALLMTSALSSTSADAGLFDKMTKKTKVPTYALNDIYSGLKFNYLDKKDRLIILNDLLTSIELQYALLPLKKELIGLNYEEVKSIAIESEKAIEDVLLDPKDKKNDDIRERVSFLQASSNLEFFDRINFLIAKFKDTHFRINTKVSKPFIYTGIRLYRIDGKILVGALENKFLSMVNKLSGADLSVIKIGDEVVSIDGVPVEEKIKELKPYISGSSEEFIDSQAVDDLLMRNYRYEKKNHIRVVFKNAGAIKLPIFANNSASSTPRLDVITYMNKYKIPSDTTSIGLTFDKVSQRWNDSRTSFTGYKPRNLAKNLSSVNEYDGEDGATAIRTGYYLNKGRAYAVLQILTYGEWYVTKGDNKLTFTEALRNFILEVKGNGAPLIIDLRVNGGGYGSLPAKLLSMIAKENDVYAPSTVALRMTQYSRGLEERRLVQQVVAEDENSVVTIDMIQNLIDTAIDNRADYTPMYAFTSPTKADPKVEGFNNKVVALVTADCVSSCDKTAYLLKDSKRAIIIGSHSNGTGAGYDSGEELNTQWGDRLSVFSTQFPNYLFGKPGKDVDTLIYGDNSVSELCTENKPTIADIQYSSTKLDLTNDNLGWLKKAVEVLDSQKDVDAPVEIPVVSIELLK